MPQAKTRGRVAVIGSYAVALVMDVDRIPLRGETLLARNFRQTYGGKGSDMAVQAARLGAQVQFLGVVGADSYGFQFQELMRREKIGTTGLRVCEDKPTGAGFIIKSPDGDNVITVDMGANEQFSIEDVDRHSELIDSSDVVLAQLEVPLTTVIHALERSKKRGKTTILNPAPAVDLTGVPLESVDYLTPNETEVRVAAGYSPDDPIEESRAAARLMAQGVKNVVVTCGWRGCLLCTNQGVVEIPAAAVRAIDTNGAGDSFNAALAVALAEDLEPEKAVRFANVVAALSCTRKETVPSYFTLEEVQAFLDGTGLDRPSFPQDSE